MNKITLIKNCGNNYDGSMTLKRRDGRHVYGNKRWLDFAGIERKDMFDKTDTDIFGPEFSAEVVAMDRKAWQESVPIEYTSELHFNNQHHNIITIKWVINTPDMPEPLLCSLADDIEKTQELRAFAKRVQDLAGLGQPPSFTVQSFKMQKILFDYLSEGIFVVGANNAINFINKACERMFGYEPGESLGLNFELFIPERLRKIHAAHRDQFNAHPEPRPMGKGLELWAVRKNGDEFPVEISLSPFQDRNGEFIIVFVTDITERRKQEMELRNAYAELEKHTTELAAINAEIRDFAYVASHHLQEPMRQLQLYSNMLRKSLRGKLSLKDTENLSKLLEFAATARERINDFQLFTRLNIDEPHKTTVNLDKVIHDVTNELADMVENEKAKITIDSEPPAVIGDPALLKQLFYNLISNSLKFCKPGVSPEIGISFKKITEVNGEHKEFLEIDIKDNGIGFDQTFGDKLFRLFQKIKPNSNGTGIGLAMCRKICNLHGGNLTAQGKEGQGATFMATLALKAVVLMICCYREILESFPPEVATAY